MSNFKQSRIRGSVKATAVVGVNAGYGHTNEAGVDLVKFGELYKDVADEAMGDAGIYVGAVAVPCKVIYKTEWGCPEGGEDAVRLEADCNPAYSESELPPAEYVAAWKETFLDVVEDLMLELDQTTVTVAFSDGQVVYLQRLPDDEAE
jgi:hypothetical protein